MKTRGRVWGHSPPPPCPTHPWAFEQAKSPGRGRVRCRCRGWQRRLRLGAQRRWRCAELARKYRMLIYSGDTDACVPTWGTDEWVRELGFAQKDGGGWRQWTSPLADGAPEQRACVRSRRDARQKCCEQNDEVS